MFDRSRRLRPHGIALFAAVLASASIPAWSGERPFDLIPTLGMRGGATLSADVPAEPPAEADPALSFGLTFDAGLSPDTWFEAFFERQTLSFTADAANFGSARFDVDVDYLHFGAAYGPARTGVRPYVTLAAGLTHFGASTGSVDTSVGFSGSIAGGFDVPMGTRAAFRFEARGYATFSDASFAVACGPGCVAQFSSGGWYQFGARAGVRFRL